MTTAVTNMTITNTPEYSEEERRQLREKWDDKLERAQHRAFTRRAADAEEDVDKRAAAMRAHFDSPRKVWFHV
jgi:hypothetical protein